VTVGITLSTSSPTLDSASSTPFYLIVTARILSTPQPSSPITLATHLNPFSPLPNRSFTDIVCINPPSQKQKQIEIQQRNWPHYVFEASDLKDDWDFITIPASGEFVIKHEVPPRLIAKAEVEKGERYRVALTHVCLGTRWWMFGDLQDEWVKDVRFVREGHKQKGREEKEGTDAEGKWYKGEIPNDLALVIEGEDDSAVEFGIV
jgi:hypothetical protein